MCVRERHHWGLICSFSSWDFHTFIDFKGCRAVSYVEYATFLFINHGDVYKGAWWPRPVLQSESQ